MISLLGTTNVENLSFHGQQENTISLFEPNSFIIRVTIVSLLQGLNQIKCN